MLKAAIDVASRPGGWSLLTRQRIAAKADCSEALVSQKLGKMGEIRRLVMRAAIRGELVDIIVQSLVASDGYAVTKWLPKTLKIKALLSIL